MSAFKVFILHAGHFYTSLFFPLKNMLPGNLYKICVRILTLLLAFPISVLLISSNFTSDFIWEERKLKKHWIQKMFDIIFWSAFLSSLYFKHSFALIFQHAESRCWMMMCFSTLPYDGSGHDRIILVGMFFRVYLWIVTRYVYSYVYSWNIFFQFCVYS